MSVPVCCENSAIPRILSRDLPADEFFRAYFALARPVIIADATAAWPARQWTVQRLRERVGGNQVLVRGLTNREDYRIGKKYTIRRESFSSYCDNLLAGNAKARSSYLAVASLQLAFPQLLPDVPLPEYLTHCGKLHLGPYMWVAFKGHYEFNHFDPDDNFLVMIEGRKQVRLFGHDLAALYPNPLGSHGKTVQSAVNCDSPDLSAFPRFAAARCQHCVLSPGEMLFIPAFYWHQVTSLDTSIAVNMFYGDAGERAFLTKVLRPPYADHFRYWFLNIIEQNRSCEAFAPRMLSRLPEVLTQFFIKQWHEHASEAQIKEVVKMVMEYLNLSTLPLRPDSDCAKYPPSLKIRGLTHRDGTIS